jgi:hypothetical protein
MSCFWEGLAKKVPELKSMKPVQILSLLQTKNCLPTHVDVLIKNKLNNLTLSQLKEHLLAIKHYHENNSLTNGHWTSTHDPFLMLVCQLWGHEIRFDFASVPITFRNTRLNSGRVLTFKSSTSHFT